MPTRTSALFNPIRMRNGGRPSARHCSLVRSIRRAARKSAAAGVQRSIGQGQRRAPERHDAVTDGLVDGALLVGNGAGDLFEIDRYLAEQVIGRSFVRRASRNSPRSEKNMVKNRFSTPSVSGMPDLIRLLDQLRPARTPRTTAANCAAAPRPTASCAISRTLDGAMRRLSERQLFDRS